MYMYNFHWILLVIMIGRGLVIILDQKEKPIVEFQTLLDLLHKPWSIFVKKQQGLPKILRIKYESSVVISLNTIEINKSLH